MGKTMEMGMLKLEATVASFTPVQFGLPDTEAGRERFLGYLVDRVTDGENVSVIAKDLKIPYSLLWGWLNDRQERINAYEAALRGRADSIVNESIDIVMNAVEKDDVPVAALKAGHLLKVAKSWDRARYGDALVVKNEGETVVTINFGKPVIEGEVEDVEAQE